MRKLTIAQVKKLAKQGQTVHIHMVPSNLTPETCPYPKSGQARVFMQEGVLSYMTANDFILPFQAYQDHFIQYHCNNKDGYRMNYYIEEDDQAMKYPSELEAPRCAECNKEMFEGYLNDSSGDTFCSGEHMNTFYEEDVVSQLNENEEDEDLDTSEIFWTTWHDLEEDRATYKRVWEAHNLLKTAPEDDLTGLYMAIDRDMLEHCNDEPEPKIRIVWTVGYNQYFSQSIASIFETSQDKATVGYIIIRPYQTVREGACKSRVYRNLQEARNVINHMKKEIR